jgi:hypothetical protein
LLTNRQRAKDGHELTTNIDAEGNYSRSFAQEGAEVKSRHKGRGIQEWPTVKIKRHILIFFTF